MGYRDLPTALGHRRAALDNERATLDQMMTGYDELRARRAEVERELCEVDAALSARRLPLLQNVQVASPCAASWDDMIGDERQRFCAACQKNVYNLSAMSEDEAEALIYETEGKLCARFYRRKDGTILTSDCPVGARRQRRRRLLIASGALAASLAGGVGVAALATPMMGEVGVVEPAVMGSIAVALDPSPPPAQVVRSSREAPANRR
jgi:hypothetical protein